MSVCLCMCVNIELADLCLLSFSLDQSLFILSTVCLLSASLISVQLSYCFLLFSLYLIFSLFSGFDAYLISRLLL